MDERTKSEPRFFLTLCGAGWVLTFAYSFLAAANKSKEAWGLSAAAEVLGAFLGWQAIAALFAIAAFGLSRSWPKGDPVRKLAAIPLIIVGLLILGVVGIVIYSIAAARDLPDPRFTPI